MPSAVSRTGFSGAFGADRPVAGRASRGKGIPAETGLDLFRSAAGRDPGAPSVRYFDGTLSYGDVDRMSDALAGRLAASGVAPGDRVALYLQNVPHVLISLIGIWKAGAICVPINPMVRERELALILGDCTPKVLICLDTLFDDVVARLEPREVSKTILAVSATEFQFRNDPRIFSRPMLAARPGVLRFAGLEERPAPARPASRSTDPAFLVYTSGTTGLPKGAVIPQGAFVFNSGTFPAAGELSGNTPVLGIAPLFHITGITAGMGAAMTLAAPLILTYRFEPHAVLDAIAEHRPGLMVAAITAYIALFNHEKATAGIFPEDLRLFSGGAPVPPSFVEEFEAKFGRYIHNCYGLTETTGPTHVVPFGWRAPTSPDGGALSVGKAIGGVTATILDEGGAPLPPGEMGELAIQGPMVCAGYWNKPEETAAAMGRHGLRTGDIALMDNQGWFYIVDRKKDVIICSGYKVWPREVEDVLYGHPAVREAAVVGVADPYRGESVKAVVSLKPAAKVSADSLIEHCRSRLAAYKYPRIIEIVDNLPKTSTGKILRRNLR